jgi:hypothetical protein
MAVRPRISGGERLIAALQASRTSVALSGTHRQPVTELGVGIAARLDKRFLWYDIRPRGVPIAAWQLALQAEFSPEQIRPIAVDEMRLDDGAGNAASSILIRDTEPDPTTLTLMDLMRLPQMLRSAILDTPAEERPSAILISNAERASSAFEGREGALRPYLEALNRSGCTVVVTTVSQPRENRHDFEMVLRLYDALESDTGKAILQCEAVRSPDRFPAVAPGTRYPLL